MRIMRMIGLASIGYGMYRAYKSYNATRPLDEHRVTMDRDLGSRDVSDLRRSL